MEKTIRKEITIEIKGDHKEAQKEKARYVRMGYTVYEENDEWIQLDRHLDK